ncbi:hypothetical protein N864_03345 [Intrasporangium chromatireducens Q5-1]|uniref:Glycosyltransferase RgtA/B/C/D-like domain-containing protein n=1 Tax=Intrasporangium chromatireducens Q5-1 TaxID=584657 RepID=W9GNH2_9MICO|nr:hypothetical protein [Intrasporangium chromatireducens]EWT07660.1 hypothetical protein N864_03345 [Intrasporangium chromatireducens Q5-1]
MTATLSPTRGTAEPRLTLPRRVVPWLAGSAIGLLLVRMTGPVVDPDTFWHISTGDYVLAHGNFVGPDPFGASATKPWVLNQWLPEVLMSWADRLGGLGAVVWLYDLVLILLVGAIWVSCRRRGSSLVAVVITALALCATIGSLSPRPQVLTFLFMALTVDAWLRTADDRRARWWLVPLNWLWACSHGMWFLGPGVALLVILGMALERPRSATRLVRLLLIPIGSLAAAALTPAGWAILVSPFQVNEVTGYIQEWQPVETSYPPFIAALVLVCLVVLSAGRTRVGRRWTTVLLALAATFLMFRYGRTIAVAGAMLAPLASVALQELTGMSREPVNRRERLALFAVPGVLVLAMTLMVPALRLPGTGPNALDPQLAALPSGTIVCNDWADGGWLIYKHPNVRVTIDPRAEIYSTDHIEGYGKLLQGQPGWQQYVDETGCRYALFGKDSAAVEVLRLSKWQRVAAGDDYLLLRAPAAGSRT